MRGLWCDWGDRSEHALRDEKPVNDISTLKEALKNPSLIVEAGGQRYYILKISTDEVVMFVTTIAEAGYYILETQLTGKNNKIFKTIDEAVKTHQKINV